MRRRDFITIFAGAAGAWPLDALAQQTTIPMIGFLSSASPNPYAGRVAAFRKGLNESGYIDGQDVTIEFRWAQGQYDRLPVFAADLVRQKVAVIVSSGGDVAALSEGSNLFDTDSGGEWHRSGEGGTCRQLQPAGGQHHRRKLCRDRVGNKAAGNITRCGAYSRGDWDTHQPDQSGR